MSASPPKEGAEAGDDRSERSGSMERGEEAQAREAYDFEVKEQDRWLPIANVARIMKTALPENAKIAKEAKECMQECVSEFISFITSEASEKCQQEKRKTVNGEDILFAMTSTGFENYAEALKIYLSKYRETQSQRGDNAAQQNRPSSSYGPQTTQPSGAGTTASTTTAYEVTDDTVNHIISPQGIDSSHQDAGFGGVYPPGTTNNGVGHEPY